MSTLNELAYNVFSSLRPHVSDDEDISIDKIKFDLLSERAALIRMDLNKGRSIDDNTLTYLDCVEVIDVDRSSCPEMPLGCFLKRTKEKIPVPIELYQGRAIQKISNLDMIGEIYNLVNYNQAINSGSRKFSGNTVYAFFRGGYIYFKSNSDLGKFLCRVSISLVLEDPTEAYQGESCYDPDSSFPLNKWMEPVILTKLKQTYLEIDLRMPSDKSNDANSDMTGPQQEKEKK